MNTPIIVGFDARERTVTIQFDEPIIDKGFVIGNPYHDPETAALRAEDERIKWELMSWKKVEKKQQ